MDPSQPCLPQNSLRASDDRVCFEREKLPNYTFKRRYAASELGHRRFHWNHFQNDFFLADVR